MEKNKSVGVLFSGGLDSTYLVWKNLKEGNRVIPIYIEIENNRDKVKLEKNRIELLINKFRENFSKELIDFIRYPLSISVGGTNVSDLPQVPVWIMGLLYSQTYDLSEIQIAYVMNDDAISFLNEIRAIYRSYNKLMGRTIPNLKPINFPLNKVSKYEILSELPIEYFDLIVSCESPKLNGVIDNNSNVLINKEIEKIEYKPCGYCEACKKVLSVYDKIKLPEVYMDIIKEKSLNNVIELKGVNVENDYNAHLMKIYIPSPEMGIEPLMKIQEPKQLSFDFEYFNIEKDIVDG